MLFVELAFEPVEHVHHVLESGALEGFARLDGPVATATDEHHGALLAIGPCESFYLIHKMGIELTVRSVVPRHHHRPHGMADEHVLHLAAAIDEDRLRIVLEEGVGLSRHQAFHKTIKKSAWRRRI